MANVQNDSLTTREVQTLEILQRIFDKYQLPPYLYSLNGYYEGAACLEKIHGIWVCFDAERATRYPEEKFANVEKACLCLMRRIAFSFTDYLLFSIQFRKELRKLNQ